MQDEQLKQWVSLAVAAERSGVSRSTFDRAAVAGEVPYAQVPLGPGRKPFRMFRLADIDEWAARRARAAA